MIPYQVLISFLLISRRNQQIYEVNFYFVFELFILSYCEIPNSSTSDLVTYSMPTDLLNQLR